MNQDLKKEMDIIGKFVLSKNTMFDLIRDKVKEQVMASKKLGLIRLGCLYDLMQRQIQKEKVDANMHNTEKFKGIYALLIQESFNVYYVYDKLMGQPVRKSFLKCHFKEGMQPKEDESKMIDNEKAVSNIQK